MNFFDTYEAARPVTPNPPNASGSTAGSSTGTGTAAGAGGVQPEQPSLNEEVNQVIGQLGRFWGGFRKQTQSTLEAARKDFGDVVVQAQKELTKLASPITTTGPSVATAGAAGSSATAGEGEGEGEGVKAEKQETEKGKEKAVESGAGEATEPATGAESSSGDAPTVPSDTNNNGDNASASSVTNTLFARLQSALPPNIVAAVQTNITALHIPESLEQLKHASETSLESLKHASETSYESLKHNSQARLESLRAAAASAGSSASAAAAGAGASASASVNAAGIDLAGLRTNLMSELQRVQGLTLAQAEEYAHKSEALLREAVKEAGEVLRDAVKVIPPEEAGGSSSSAGPAAVLWDGTEMWLLPESTSASASASTINLGASTSSAKGGLETTASAVKTRAEALLLRLKQDPDILRHDPEVEEGVRERYQAWKEKEVDTVDGGIDGAEWKAKIKEAVEDIRDGAHLRALEDTLVPSEMTQSAFWLRYFFRAYQIRSEEAKRQALLQSSNDNDDDFSWEDDEEEASPVKTTLPSTTSQTTLKPPAKDTLTVPDDKDATGSGANSPRRLSSEDSFDLVSGTSSVAGDLPPARQAAAKAAEAKAAAQKKEEEEEDGDSDWE